MTLDERIINFRDYINSNISYIEKKYIYDNSKNLFNCICSCMDWIEVSRDTINSFNYDPDKFDNKACMDIYSYISAIDIINESVNQLNRVFKLTNKLIFNNDTTIFKNSLSLDDNNHFKELRAAFGAHPVNLKNKENCEIKYFASWPIKSMFDDTFDLYCNLYINLKDSPDKKIGFKFEDLEKFVQIRYNILNDFINKIEKERKTFYLNKIKLIPKECINPLDEISSLKDFLFYELGIDSFDYYLDNIYKLLSFYKSYPNKSDLTEKYVLSLIELLRNFRFNIKKCNFEYNFGDILNPKINPSFVKTTPPSVRTSIYYDLEKIYNYIYSGTDSHVLKYHIKNFNYYFANIVELNSNMQKLELDLLIKSARYSVK
ncbi:MAG: hypothetical protein ACRC1T_18240 [Clostridium chrysemydis]|uniref:hypothetical protein n=1 Tax=Clostridium chrysemydis TaxID=2665504 RepID=UPI003F328BFF